MTDFATCLQLNNLGAIIEEQYGKYRHDSFTQEVADVILRAAEMEVQEVGPRALLDLCAQLATTLMNENVFDLSPMPNMNGHPEDVTKWDLGPAARNVFWTRKEIEVGIYEGLPESEVFGTLIPNAPVPFDGNQLSNLRIAARDLLSIHAARDAPGVSESRIETQVVHYTGPDHWDHRRADWRKYNPLFTSFFIEYDGLA